MCSVAFDAAGERLASGGYDRTVRLWRLEPDGSGGTTTFVLEGHKGDVRCIAFSANGK